MSNVLEVEHLTVGFGKSTVLKDLSFAVEEGSALAIIGPNGSGKTLLFRALINALPFRGAIRWSAGTRIGYVPQKLDIERDLPITGRDFLRAKIAVSKAPAAQLEQMLELVSLGKEIVDAPIGAFSGGQFQRLLLAFALLGQPNVLLFDEPTSGVDEPGEGKLYEMIHRLQEEQRLTLLLISHELSVVYRYANNVLCLNREHHCLGVPEEILTPQRIEEVYGTPLKFHHHHMNHRDPAP